MVRCNTPRLEILGAGIEVKDRSEAAAARHRIFTQLTSSEKVVDIDQKECDVGGEKVVIDLWFGPSNRGTKSKAVEDFVDCFDILLVRFA